MLLLVSMLAAQNCAPRHCRGAKRLAGIVSPTGVALLKRVGRNRVWLSIPPRTPVEDFLSVRTRNYSGLRAEARLLPPYEFAAVSHQRFATSYGSVACMIRDPQLRVDQELERRCREWRRCDRNTETRLMGVQAKVLLRESRPLTRYDDETVRLLPQTWYVYGPNGHPTCHCALSYDNVARVARQSRPVPVIRRGHVPWSVSLASLYVEDTRLYRNVSGVLRQSAPSACYRVGRRAVP